MHMPDHLMGRSDMNRMLEEAARAQQQQAQQQQMLAQVLQHTLSQPQRVTQLNLSLTGLRREGRQVILMVALPTGERVDVPMNARGAAALAGGLTQAVDDDAQEQEAERGEQP